MTDVAAFKAANARRWANARLIGSFSAVATHLVSPEAKSRYRAVSAKTGVPGLRRRRSRAGVFAGLDRIAGAGGPLGQGIDSRSGWTGAFQVLGRAAIDALDNCAPYAGHNKDWSIGGLLTKLEEYNGLGYARAVCLLHICGRGPTRYRSGGYVPRQRVQPEHRR